jgi:hypothetical protein
VLEKQIAQIFAGYFSDYLPQIAQIYAELTRAIPGRKNTLPKCNLCLSRNLHGPTSLGLRQTCLRDKTISQFCVNLRDLREKNAVTPA